jgi:hypothetical protein
LCRYLGNRQRQRRRECAQDRCDIVLSYKAAGDGRRCGGVRGRVADDQVDFGAAECLDAPACVDLIGDELNAVAGIDAELSICSGTSWRFSG